MSALGGSHYEELGGVYLMDVETHNAIDFYRTEDDALRDIADIVAEHGRHSAEARSLLMYRDGHEDGGVSGDALITRALERTRLAEPRTAY